MAFIRKIRKGDSIYLAKVESYREDGKVKQRVIEYIGKEENGVAVQKVDINRLQVNNVKHYADVSVLCQICKQLNLQYLLGKHNKPIIALVIAHLICKASIFRMSKWIQNSTIKEELGLDELSTEMLYSALDYLEECDFNKIEHSIFETWKLLDPHDTKSYVLDVTDTYIKGKHDETCVRKGKDGKVSKLKQIGLAVSFDNGFPIMHKTYNGTIHNVKILDDLMAVMAERGVNTIVLDRGFFSEAAINDMHKLKMKMIVGMKQTAGIKKDILNRINRDSIYIKANQVPLKNTFVYAQEIKFMFGKIIVIYNPKYEALKRDKMLSEESTDQDVRYVGYSLIFHNTNLDPKNVVKKYFDKDIIERSFRTMKTEIKLHPIRHWMPSRINAHIKVCYLCMCILSLIQFKCKALKVSAIDAVSELESIYKIKMMHSTTKQSFTKVVTQSKLQKDIIKHLKCSV